MGSGKLGTAGAGLEILGWASLEIWPKQSWIAYAMFIGGFLLIAWAIIPLLLQLLPQRNHPAELVELHDAAHEVYELCAKYSSYSARFLLMEREGERYQKMGAALLITRLAQESLWGRVGHSSVYVEIPAEDAKRARIEEDGQTLKYGNSTYRNVGIKRGDLDRMLGQIDRDEEEIMRSDQLKGF